MKEGQVTPSFDLALEQNTNTKDKGAAPPATPKATVTAPDDKAAAPTAAPESKPDRKDKPEPAPAKDAWAELRRGSYVVAKYWESDGTPYGWWLGVITDIDKNDICVRWPDEPLKPAVKLERRHVAILHPSYDASREWDRRS